MYMLLIHASLPHSQHATHSTQKVNLGCRFEQMANEMLANSTVAGQEGTLDFLIANAALQQFGQAALALLVLHRSQGTPLTADALEQEAEELLQEHFQVGFWCEREVYVCVCIFAQREGGRAMHAGACVCTCSPA